MANIDFEKLKHSEGGLISFDSFLSTTTDERIACGFAEPSIEVPGLKAILFIIHVDPSCTSSPVASLDGLTDDHSEREILFGMSTISRIGKITQGKQLVCGM